MLGLKAGDRVRFQRTDGGRWQEGTVVGREKDGSVALFDAKGAARAIVVERLEVRTRGPRGAVAWEPVVERAGRSEQMSLLAEPAPERRPSRRTGPGPGGRAR